jgi:hypothetical protein
MDNHQTRLSAKHLSDKQLLEAWNATDGNGSVAEVLLAEIEKRSLDT